MAPEPSRTKERPWLFSLVRLMGIGVIAVVLCVTAVRSNLSNTASRTNAAMAMVLAPNNGNAMDAVANSQLAVMAVNEAAKPNEKLRFDQTEAETIANESLKREPFSLSSIALLARIEGKKGNRQTADLLLDHGGQLSRRNTALQLLLIQRAAERGNIEELVRQIDTTLRTRQSTYPTLFPILAKSISDPLVLGPLTKIAREDPSWYKLFIGEALTEPTALPIVRQLMIAVPDGSAAQDQQLRLNLISQLISNGKIELARSYFEGRHQPDSGLITDPTFLHPEYEPPFGWTLQDDPGLSADFVKGDGLGAFASADREGIVARQLLDLKVGRYSLSLEGGASSLKLALVEIRCLNGKALSLDSRELGKFGFVIPANCPAQTVGIGVQGSGNTSRETEAFFRSVTIKKAP